MAATLVATVKTSCTTDQLIAGFVEGWYKQFNVFPKKEAVGVLYAQNTLETGGTISMWNFNVGNVKFVANKNPDLDNNIKYMMLANVWEVVNGVKQTFQPPNPATWFRAFDTLADGVAFQLNFLRNNRYKTAWTAVEAGKPADFAHLLKVAGYYTAPEADYVKLMNVYFNKYMKQNTFETALAKLQASLAPVPVEPDPAPETPSEPVVEPLPVPEAPVVETAPTPPPAAKKSTLETVLGFIFPILNMFKKK